MMKHTEDDGDLSIFASGNQLLVACSKGHYWLLDAAQHLTEPERKRDVRTAEGHTLRQLTERFGTKAAQFLRPDKA